jgi:hypothetical protein
MSDTIEFYNNGGTDTIELLNILKWKYDFHEKTNEFDCIKEITNHKGNWRIVFKDKPSVHLILAIVTIFDTLLSYDGLEDLIYKETRVHEVAGCLAMNQKMKIIKALEFCR